MEIKKIHQDFSVCKLLLQLLVRIHREASRSNGYAASFFNGRREIVTDDVVHIIEYLHLLFLAILTYFHDVGNIALQADAYFSEHIGTDGFIFTELRQCPRADSGLDAKLALRHVAVDQELP